MFLAHTELDGFGLGQKLEEVRGQWSIIPPQPATLRAALSGLLIRFAARLLWWILRAFRIRDEALVSIHSAILHLWEQDVQRSFALRAEMQALSSRIERLESAGGKIGLDPYS